MEWTGRQEQASGPFCPAGGPEQKNAPAGSRCIFCGRRSGLGDGLGLFLGGLGPALELRHRRDFVARPGVGALGALHAFFCHGFTSDVVVGDGLLFGGPVLILVLPGDGRLPPALFHAGALVVRLAVLRHRNHPA